MLGSSPPFYCPKPAALRKACGGSIGADPLVSRGPRVAALCVRFVRSGGVVGCLAGVRWRSGGY